MVVVVVVVEEKNKNQQRGLRKRRVKASRRYGYKGGAGDGAGKVQEG